MASIILLGYREIFASGELDNKLELANKVGRNDIINLIGYLMGGIHKGGGIQDASEFIKDWFTYNSHRYTESVAYNTVAERISALQRLNPNSTLTLISVEALLRLFSWVREQWSNINPEGSVTDASVTIDLLKLILSFNTEVLTNIKRGRESTKHLSDYMSPYGGILALSFSSNDFVNADLAQIFACQIYKAAKLLEFMKNTPEYQLLHQKILKDFGCADNKEYIQGIGAILAGVMSAGTGKTTITIPDGPDRQKNINLFEKLAIQPSTDSAVYDQDFLDLRTAPLYKVSEGEYRAIYEPFLIKTIYDGLVFYCWRACQKDPSLFNNADFIADIKLDFSEGVLLYELVNRIFNQPSDIKLNGNEVKEIMGTAGRESDYYLCRVAKAACFESKDIFMTGKEKLSYDFETIIGGLKKDGRFGKAVLQLATNAIRILNGLYPTNGVPPADMEVYPILLVHSPLYSCQTLNFWVNKWFDEEIAKLKKQPGYAHMDVSNIKPVTIIEIDTIILYEQSFSDGTFDLFDLIDEYQNRISVRKTAASFTEARSHALLQLPFAHFIRQKAHHLGITLDLSILTEILSDIGLT